MDSTLPSPTITPSATSARAPMKQLSSMMVGAACSGSSTPPRPAPPEMWQCAPTWAQEPTVAQVSIMVPSPTRAPTLTKLGIRTAPLAMKAERRTTAPGTARKPAARNLRLVPAQEFGIDLVPPHRTVRRAVDQLHVVEAEGQQHGLLQPFMHLPLAADLLGHPQGAAVQPVQRRFHRIAFRALGGRRPTVRAFPRPRRWRALNSLMFKS